MHNVTHNFLRLVYVLGTFLFVLIGQAPLSTAEENSKILFGALSELTGPGARNGEACQLGYKIAYNLFCKASPERAKQVEIVYGDHRREAKTGIAEFQRLAQLGVWGVAANHSIVGVALNPISREMHIPLFGVMGHDSFVRDNPYALRIIPTAQQEGGGLARKAISREARRAAILVLEDDYLLAVAAEFEKAFKEHGGKIVYRDSIEESTPDFAAIAARIRAAKPDVIAMTLGFQQFGPAIRRLRELGVTQPIYSNYWLSYPDVIASAGSAENVEGSVFITEKSEFPAFVEEYNKLAQGTFRSGVVFRCYTALALPLAVIGAHPEIDTRDKFVAAVTETSTIKLPDRELHVVGREVLFQSEYFSLHQGKPAPLS